MSSGLPIEVTTSDRAGAATASHYLLDMDISANRPRVVLDEQVANPSGWRGTELRVVIEGTWQYRSRVIAYMRQLAVVTPYAQLRLEYRGGRESFSLEFIRRTDRLPPRALTVKHHPGSVHLVLVRALAASWVGRSLATFIAREFSSVSASLARALVAEMRLPPDVRVDELGDEQWAHLLSLFRSVTIPPPDGRCLSPAGEYNLFLGILKEIQPELVATHQCAPDVYEGHPFIVEAGVSVGGSVVPPGVSVYRFANRIPLIFEGGADVVTRTASEFRWGQYKLRAAVDRIGVFVSIVSTKIPFKGTGKEYIGDEAGPIKAAVARALRGCCTQLKVKLAGRQQLRSRAERRRKLEKYVPVVARSIAAVLATAVDDRARDAESDSSAEPGEPPSPPRKRRRLLSGPAEQLLDKVAAHTVGEPQLLRALHEHVERVDVDEAFQLVAERGLANAAPRTDLVLAPLAPGTPLLLVTALRLPLALQPSVIRRP